MDINQLKAIRDETGGSFALCKEALNLHKDDIKKAIEYIAQQMQAQELKEGVMEVYAHGINKNIGVMVEVNCETDFVAQTDRFRKFAHEVALQVAAMNPLYVSREQINGDAIQNLERKFLKEMVSLKKPDSLKRKIVNDKKSKYFQEVCLLEQLSFRNSTKTIQDLLEEVIKEVRENVKINRFVRWQM